MVDQREIAALGEKVWMLVEDQRGLPVGKVLGLAVVVGVELAIGLLEVESSAMVPMAAHHLLASCLVGTRTLT